MTSLVWMRRDLRLDDHATLATALGESAPVQPVFVFDTDILARFSNPDDRRLGFLARALCAIDQQLRARGGRLLMLHGRAEELIPRLAQALNATSLFAAEDFEPMTRARDAAVKAALQPACRMVQPLDHLIHSPQTLCKSDGTAYKVFTPYYKVWRSKLGPSDWVEYAVKDAGRYADPAAVSASLAAASVKPLDLAQGPAHLLTQIGYRYTDDPLWPVENTQAQLQEFVAARLANYATGRDVLPRRGTSQLSPYLRFGLVSIRACIRAALDQSGGEKWISELGWREFYAGILYHFPHVVSQEFNPIYRGTIPWTDNAEYKTALFSGRTGYPVVDAGVRELLETGYMHNRARMIVASFATKDLLLDWREGEAFFAQYLMDYDLASNNGGWQWAASTGTDASPYFRVFNPTLQGQKFDPDGEYVKRYIPELRDVAPKYIHAPWTAPVPPRGYPRPIVDHAAAKDRAIAVFKAAGLKII